MKNSIRLLLFGAAFFAGGCSKDATEPVPGTATEAQVLTDFANVLANANYADLQIRAGTLNETIAALNANTVDANLVAARAAWRDTRAVWESAEGYLFGPIEDDNYDPAMDTWPLNRVELDSLLASSNPLSVDDIHALPYSLKGFHAIEYVIFGPGGTRTAAQISAREMQYLSSLGQDLYNTATRLRNSWDPSQPDSFTRELTSAGAGSRRFATRNQAFLAIVSAMSGICEEVAHGKMQAPLGPPADSTLSESMFSHNSTADFRNNMTGVLNAYLCRYAADGHGMDELVAAGNISLDNSIRSQLAEVIRSFDAISPDYEEAIYTQQAQIRNTQDAIDRLQGLLDNDLTAFINAHIAD